MKSAEQGVAPVALPSGNGGGLLSGLFGVPAAYCAPLFDAAPAHGITSVVAASDLEAGYSADGYARTRGLAAVSVAYGVGTLSMINAIADTMNVLILFFKRFPPGDTLPAT